MAWVCGQLCKLQKGCSRLAAASDKVNQLVAHCRWFSPGTPASSTTKTGRHDIAEMLLRVALKHQKSKSNQPYLVTTLILKQAILQIHLRPIHQETDSEDELRTNIYDKWNDFSVKFLVICSNIPSELSYEVHVCISQLIRYSRASGSYQEFPNK